MLKISIKTSGILLLIYGVSLILIFSLALLSKIIAEPNEVTGFFGLAIIMIIIGSLLYSKARA